MYSFFQVVRQHFSRQPAVHRNGATGVPSPSRARTRRAPRAPGRSRTVTPSGSTPDGAPARSSSSRLSSTSSVPATPTIPYVPALLAGNSVTEARIDAWFVDIIGGWRIGSLLLEGRYVYTTGNRPKDQLNRDVNYYQPLDTDTGVLVGHGARSTASASTTSTPPSGAWAVRSASTATAGTSSRSGPPTASRPSSIVRGDRVARVDGSVGGHGWAVVPPVQAPRAIGAVLCNTNTAGPGAGCNGDASYIGTEVGARPHLAVRAGPGAGPGRRASSSRGARWTPPRSCNGVLTKMESKNIYTVVSRVRYSF